MDVKPVSNWLVFNRDLIFTLISKLDVYHVLLFLMLLCLSYSTKTIYVALSDGYGAPCTCSPMQDLSA